MTANTEGILDFLHEFKANVTEGKDIFTVAEANGVTPEQLPLWVGKQGVFDMLFPRRPSRNGVSFNKKTPALADAL